jgi:hypothetical protein
MLLMPHVRSFFVAISGKATSQQVLRELPGLGLQEQPVRQGLPVLVRRERVLLQEPGPEPGFQQLLPASALLPFCNQLPQKIMSRIKAGKE